MSEEPGTLDTYHDPNKLIRLSAWSVNISWVILIMAIVLTLFRLVNEIPQYFEQPPGLLDSFMIVFSPLYTFAIGLFYFLVLQAISEGINIWMDIHENTLPNHTQIDPILPE